MVANLGDPPSVIAERAWNRVGERDISGGEGEWKGEVVMTLQIWRRAGPSHCDRLGAPHFQYNNREQINDHFSWYVLDSRN